MCGLLPRKNESFTKKAVAELESEEPDDDVAGAHIHENMQNWRVVPVLDLVMISGSDEQTARKVSHVSCGRWHFALLSKGKLFTWGLGETPRNSLNTASHTGDKSAHHIPDFANDWDGQYLGQLAVPQFAVNPQLTGTMTGTRFEICLMEAKALAETQVVPQRCKGTSGMRIVQVGCGQNHMACMTAGGKLWTWGQGDLLGRDYHAFNSSSRCRPWQSHQGRCRLTPSFSAWPAPVRHLPGGFEAARVTALSCGRLHTVIRVANGDRTHLCTFGGNESGQLGLGDDDISHQGYSSGGSGGRNQSQRNPTVVCAAPGRNAHTPGIDQLPEPFSSTGFASTGSVEWGTFRCTIADSDSDDECL